MSIYIFRFSLPRLVIIFLHICMVFRSEIELEKPYIQDTPICRTNLTLQKYLQ